MVYTHDTQGPPFQCAQLHSYTVRQSSSAVLVNPKVASSQGVTHDTQEPTSLCLCSTLSDCLVQQCW